jgi:hypothetical protein
LLQRFAACVPASADQDGFELNAPDTALNPAPDSRLMGPTGNMRRDIADGNGVAVMQINHRGYSRKKAA